MTDEVSFSEALQMALAVESAELHAADILTTQSAAQVAAVNKLSAASKGLCFSCGGDHYRRDCKYKDVICNTCNRRGHLSRVCRSSDRVQPPSSPTRRGGNVRRRNYSRNEAPRSTYVIKDCEAAETSKSIDSSEVGEALYTIGCVENMTCPNIEVCVQIQDKEVIMQVDTGASLSIIFGVTYHKLGDISLRKFKHRLATNTGEIGCIEVDVRYEHQRAYLPLMVVDGCGPSLLDRNWLQHLRLDWPNICSVQHSSVDDVLSEYAEVFSPGLNKYTEPAVKLLIDSTANLHFYKARPVPYVIKGKVQDAIEENVKLRIWEPTDYSEWATPIVPILKKDNTVRLCGDYKITVNQICKVDPFPLLRIEDIFAQLHGGKRFTKMDLHAAYSQIPMDEESQRYLTVMTH